jgi:ribonuclease J
MNGPLPGEGSSPLRLIPLGGLGEFGLNALVLEWRDHLLLVDAGVQFPTAEMPGVDSIVPDFQYLIDRADKLRGILLTHGHEDHIGALAFALQAAPAPVYGSRLTLGFAQRRLRDRGTTADLRLLTPGRPEEIGPFRVHPIRVAHSVLDSLALAIETPAGVVLASGDFKIDAGAAPEERTDLEALGAWGDRGVLVLLSDSTNVEQTGATPGEDAVGPAFEEVLARTRGRVLVSCFATAIPRMQRVADLAVRAGRPVAFVGRRMVDNAEVAMDLGLLRVPMGAQVPVDVLAEMPPGNRTVVFVSGSQGEPMSALSLVSVGEHRAVAAGPGDTVVLSARAIPGNERTVSRLISNLFRLGCDVVHPGTARVHVSGHGNQDDLRELLLRTRPRYLVPVHGEYRMLAQHARLAAQAGFPADHVLVAEDGDVLAFSAEGARKEARVPAGRTLLDRGGALEVEDVVVRDRRHLSSEGIVVPIVVLDRQTGRLESPPEIVTRGFVDTTESADLLDEAGRLLEAALADRPHEERLDGDLTRERIRMELRRFFKKRTQRRPMVIPVVMEV